jgi:hypothetical protein
MAKPPLHTVVETPSYRAAAKQAGLSQDELDAVLDAVMANPAAGELIRGSGGVRKVRIGKDEGGKSGGYRALTYFMDMAAPAFLLFVIDKADIENISDAQRNQLRTAAKAIKDERRKAEAERKPGGGPSRGRR